MVANRRITSIAQLRTLDDQILTECYVLGIGFTGLSAIAEHPVPARRSVYVDLAYVNEAGELEGETVRGRVLACTPRTGAHLINVAFLKDLRADPESGLARYIRRELGLGRTGSAPPPRANEAGSS